MPSHSRRITLHLAGLLALTLLGGCQPETPPRPSDFPEAWQPYDLRDPSLPELFIADGDSLRLDPSWQVKSAEYAYNGGWFLGEEAYDYLRVTRTGDTFTGDPEWPISPDQVQGLVDSIRHLYPARALLRVSMWTDDSPSWTIDLTGADGNHVQLFSSSANIDAVPWNVLYNGRLYAQFDGSLASGVAGLFSSAERSPVGGLRASTEQPLGYATHGTPPQLDYGFNGLTPFAHWWGFYYQADLPNHQLILGLGWLDPALKFVSASGRGEFTQVQSVRVTLTSGSTVACDLRAQPDPLAPPEYTCPTPGSSAGQKYRYPVEIEMADSGGSQAYVVSGELVGEWGRSRELPLMPAPDEIASVFREDQDIADLLKDHFIANVFIQGEVDKATRRPRVATGELWLGSAAQVDGRTLHTVFIAPFGIEDGKVVNWSLTRAVADQMLKDVLPYTGAWLEADPDVVLYMGYRIEETYPHSAFMDAMTMGYKLPLKTTCTGFTEATLPSPDAPLATFGFNYPDISFQPQFVLVDHKPIPTMFDFYSPARDSFIHLLPEQLDTDVARRLSRITLSQRDFSAFGDSGNDAVMLYIPAGASDEDRRAFDELAGSLGGAVDRSDPTRIGVDGIRIIALDGGKLGIAPCEP